MVKDFASLLSKRWHVNILCAKLVPISKILGATNKVICCPFHPDRTPSAKFFVDEADGIERLFCFSCRKQFTSSDYIIKSLEQDVVAYLKGHFTDVQLDAASRAIDFDARVRKPVATESARQLYRTTGDINLMLASLYKPYHFPMGNLTQTGL